MGQPIKYSLRLKSALIIAAMCLMTGVLVVFIGYQLYSQRIQDHYITEGKVLVDAVSDVIDWDALDTYSRTKKEDAEYRETLENIRLAAEAGAATYVYVAKPFDGGVMFLYDSDESEEHYSLGELLSWEEAKEEFPKSIMDQTDTDGLVTNDRYGWMLSVYEREYNSKGEFVAYVVIDYSIESFVEEQRRFIVDLALVTVLIVAALTVIFAFVMRWLVVRPVNRIADSASSYLVGENVDVEGQNSITELRVETKDELEGLSRALKTMESKIQSYLKDLKEATRRAETDPMTSFYNREAFEQRVEALLKQGGPDRLCAFMMIDLDNFKTINDTWGHAAGDEVLAAFAHVMRSEFGADLIGRMGGDEFAVFCVCPASSDEVEGRAAALCEAARRIRFDHDIKTTISIGVALCHGGSDFGYHNLYLAADDALYEAKKNGRNDFCVTVCS